MASHGRYTILGKLADGGMAEIFLALQHGAEGFEKPVVLKRILTQYSADPQFRNMLLDEAHISMSLQHGNVVQVLDLGVAAGRYFLALELVDGWDLEKVLQRAHAAAMVWPTALGLYVVAEVCRGLAYAHGKTRDGKPLGIVHRDISPNNVLLSGEGEVKVADFGIAKAQRKREQTAAGVIKGKVAYMSPEQAQGGAVDRRSDIFSVGSLLYRTMTDRLPFEANNDLESLMRVQKAEFAPPRDVKPTLQDSVSKIILRAMRLAPSERYQSADEMLADIERVLRTEFQSAGQTELKAWLVQLARRDGALSIGKQRREDSGVVKDVMGTDLSAGTSFELGDLDLSAAHTEASLPRLSPPDFKGAPRTDARPEPPKGGSTAEIAKPSKTSAGRRRSSGFWLGVTLALGAVVGFHYLSGWAQKKGVMRVLGLGNDAAVERTPTVSVPVAPPLAPAPVPEAQKAVGVPPLPVAAAEAPSAKPLAAVDAAAVPAASTGGAVDADTRPQVAEGTPGPTAKKVAEPDDDEPDEEALLRDAVPNAEDAVIGEDDAEASAAKPKPAGKSRKAASKPAAELPRVETAVLHFTSAPSGAVVRTKARVLGRTPISLHFKTGNTYEVLLIKRGFEPATRKVSVHSTKDRKVAVILKKRAPPKKLPFFHPHR
jgi:serine/threonine protein kinase